MIIFKKYIYIFKFIILIILFVVDSQNIIINIIFFFNIYILKHIKHKIIEIDNSEIHSFRGPGRFSKGIYKHLPFISDKCVFIFSSNINFMFKIDYYYVPHPKFKERQFEKLVKNKLINKYILGPIFVPKKWFSFPSKGDWKEERFPEILNASKGIAVHSNRVIAYLSQKSNTTDNLEKYKIVRACSNFEPKNVNSFKDRKIDILFFEKYADLDRQKQGLDLLKLLKSSTNNIVKISYGSYKKKEIKELANNSRFIIYFSFYDTGAIGLKEIQNYGVLTFSHQKDLVINNETCFYIPELENTDDMSPAANKILNIIQIISKINPNTKLIAKKNQLINNCQNALNDLCQSLF